MNPLYAAAGGGALVLALIGGAFALGVRTGEDHAEAASKRDDRVAAVASAAAASAAASAISAITPEYRTIYQDTQHEIITNTVYGDCRNLPDVMRNINKALSGAKPSGSGLVPRAGTVK